MKKLIAISVVFVLLAGAAFAETSIGGAVIVKGILAGGTTQDAYPASTAYEGFDIEDPTAYIPGDAYSGNNYKGIKSGIDFKRFRLAATTSNDEGTFGGHIRIGDSNDLDYSSFSGYGWWKPINALRIQLGKNADGDFGADGVTRYNFYGDAGDVGIPEHFWGFGNSFYGGFNPDNGGLLITISPIEALAINLGLPFASVYDGGWDQLTEYFLKKINAQVKYTIDGIGTIALTYEGGLGHAEPKDAEAAKVPGTSGGDITEPGVSAIPGKDEINDPSKLYLYFGLSAIENLGIDVGVGFTLPVTETGPDYDSANKGDDDITHNAKLSVGLGAKFDSGSFGIKARVQGDLLGGTKEKDFEHKAPLVIRFDVLPYYGVSDALKIFLSAGIVFTGAEEATWTGAVAGTSTINSAFDWHVNPYLTFSAWPGTFYAGFRLEGNGARSAEYGSTTKTKVALSNSYVNWSVPIGMSVSF